MPIRIENTISDLETSNTTTVDFVYDGNEIAMEYEDALGTGCSSCGTGSGSKPYRVIYPTFEREFIYDMRGRKTHEKDVLVGEGQKYITYFLFDDTGNLISKTDEEDQTTSYEYDSLTRLTNGIVVFFNKRNSNQQPKQR